MTTASSFEILGVSEPLCASLKLVGYAAPTPIQALVIPPLVAGRDVIAKSKTGSGKTAGFSIPLLEKVDPSNRDVQAVVLCPTRELCLQVAREMRRLARHHRDLHILTLFGGQPVSRDRKSLEQGAQVIVGTPGRVGDHLQRRSLDFSQVKYLVLDEADRMLDMGFRDKIESILNTMPRTRQSALFSATYPATIENLAKRYLRDAEKLEAPNAAEDLPDIEEVFYRADDATKMELLQQYAADSTFQSMLVFCNLKVRVDSVAQALGKMGHSVDRLHGDLEQVQRERTMARFRNGSTRILIATDIAARGLDITGLDAVINFDFPVDPAHYVHRIGRTGRAGAKGFALSFLTDREDAKVELLESLTGREVVFSKLPSSAPVKNAGPVAPRSQMDTLSISGGRRQKVRPGDILGALTGDAGIPGTDVGKIEILDNVSFVAIASASAAMAQNRLQNGKIKGRRFVVQFVR